MELPDEAFEKAIVIRGATDSIAGIQEEYRQLAKMFGKQGRDWDLEFQRLAHKGGRDYDDMHIRLADGTKRVVLFDITEFFGKHLMEKKTESEG